jgi:hypothetical protein
VSEHRIFSGPVFSIGLGGDKVKNLHGTKGGFSNPISSGKDTMDRHAGGMEGLTRKEACPYSFDRPQLAISAPIGIIE